MELFQASRQWAKRPDDQRFWNVDELHQVVSDYRSRATEKTVPYRQLEARALSGDEVQLVNKETGGASRLTHWAFGQLAQRSEAPASYLRGLPAELAATLINHGIGKRDYSESANLMFHENGSRIARSITSERYDRIWNSDISPYLVDLRNDGWTTPPAWDLMADKSPRARIATAADVGEYTIVKQGQRIAPSGVYASDHDMFVFMVDPRRQIADGSDGGLFRGFFCWNSEVGASSFGIETFLFRYICGNHIVWSASKVSKIRIRHVGSASARFGREFVGTIKQYRDQSAIDDEQAIARARTMRLGDDKDAVLQKIFGMRLGVSQSVITGSFETGLENADTDGDPKTVYGMVNAMTRYSQTIPYADERATVDRAAGKVMQSAF